MKIKIIIVSILIGLLGFFSCNQRQVEVTEINEEMVTTETTIDSDVFVVVEKMPEFDGDMFVFISENITYPDSAKIKGIEGTVFIKFIVEENGEITNVKLIRGVDKLIDDEALKVVNSMPNWLPGYKDDVAVRVEYALPIAFKLQ